MAGYRERWGQRMQPWVHRLDERMGPAVALGRADVALLRVWLKHRGAVEAALGPEIAERYTELLMVAASSDVAVARTLAWSLPDHFARAPEQSRLPLSRLLVGVARTNVRALPLTMRTLPELMARMEGVALARYVAQAVTLFDESPARAESFLRLESQEARTTADGLKEGLSLEKVRRMLQLYAQAHCGVDVVVRTDTHGGRSFCDGRNIVLPSVVNQFPDERNFLVYRVLTARNAGFIEFGTLDLDLSRVPWGGEAPPDWGGAYTGGIGGWPERRDGELEVERMIRGFPNPAMARDLFLVLENARIEARLRIAYPGIARDLDQLGQEWRPARPAWKDLSPAEQVVEGVARAAIGLPGDLPLDPQVRAALDLALLAVARVCQADADVHSTAEAVWTAYLPAHGLLRRANPKEDDRIRAPDGEGKEPPPPSAEASRTEAPAPDEKEGYRGIGDDPTAGKLNLGELSAEDRALEARTQQLLDAMQEQGGQATRAEARAEAQREAREAMNYEEMADMLDRNPAPAGPLRGDDEAAVDGEVARSTGQSLTADTTGRGVSVRYPEWDAAIGDHKPDWVRVTEYTLAKGGTAFVDQVRNEFGAHIRRTRKAFEGLRPDALRRQRALVDGDEIDIERAILERIEVRAGGAADGRVYQRQRPRDRDVAVAFLVDMSSSTNEVVKRGGKRVIEVEKEALVLTAEAVDAMGDSCAIWGYSGYGREQVAFYVAKELDEPWDDTARQRLGRMSWKMENRDGAAIRHATQKMQKWPARVRLLVLLSDGRPLDCGCDQYADRYAQEDTRMALLEARRQGIHPFCITVDPRGQAYLGRMFGEGSYIVISDVDHLPEKLTRTWRRLTR